VEFLIDLLNQFLPNLKNETLFYNNYKIVHLFVLSLKGSEIGAFSTELSVSLCNNILSLGFENAPEVIEEALRLLKQDTCAYAGIKICKLVNDSSTSLNAATTPIWKTTGTSQLLES